MRELIGEEPEEGKGGKWLVEKATNDFLHKILPAHIGSCDTPNMAS